MANVFLMSSIVVIVALVGTLVCRSVNCECNQQMNIKADMSSVRQIAMPQECHNDVIMK